MEAEILPSGHTADHSPLEKNQCDRKAASHPLPVLLNLSFENEDQCNPGSNHPQRGVHRGRNPKRSGIAHAFLEVLDVKAEWHGHEHTCDIDSSDYTMALPKTRPKSVRALHCAKQQTARPGNTPPHHPALH